MTLPEETEHMTIEEAMRHIIVERFKKWRGSMKALAENLGITEPTLYRKLRQYGIYNTKKI